MLLLVVAACLCAANLQPATRQQITQVTGCWVLLLLLRTADSGKGAPRNTEAEYAGGEGGIFRREKQNNEEKRARKQREIKRGKRHFVVLCRLDFSGRVGSSSRVPAIYHLTLPSGAPAPGRILSESRGGCRHNHRISRTRADSSPACGETPHTTKATDLLVYVLTELLVFKVKDKVLPCWILLG